MKTIAFLKTKISAFAISTIFLTACDGSRARRVYDSGRSVYEDYEETGDPTWLIIFIVLLVVVGGLWIWKKLSK